MKPYLLVITLLFSGLSIAVAQQRTRDVLFPSFQQDYSALQQKESKLPPSQTRNARSAREQMFTNYQPQHAATGNRTKALKRTTSGDKNPSDMSSAEAQKTAQSKRENLPAPVIPSQGNETESNNAPVRTAAPAAITPAKTGTPATAPVRKQIERKKQ